MLSLKSKRNSRRDHLWVAVIWFFVVTCGVGYAAFSPDTSTAPPSLRNTAEAGDIAAGVNATSAAGGGTTGNLAVLLTAGVKQTDQITSHQDTVSDKNGVSDRTNERQQMHADNAAQNAKLQKHATDKAAGERDLKAARGEIEQGMKNEMVRCKTSYCAMRVAQSYTAGGGYDDDRPTGTGENNNSFFSKAYATDLAGGTSVSSHGVGNFGAKSTRVPRSQCKQPQPDPKKHEYCRHIAKIAAQLYLAFGASGGRGAQDIAETTEAYAANERFMLANVDTKFMENATGSNGGIGDNSDPHFFASSAYAAQSSPETAGDQYFNTDLTQIAQDEQGIGCSACTNVSMAEARTFNTDCKNGTNGSDCTEALQKNLHQTVDQTNFGASQDTPVAPEPNNAPIIIASSSSGTSQGAQLYTPPKELISSLSLHDLFGKQPQAMVAQNSLKGIFGPQPMNLKTLMAQNAR
jgi:hypothetical protein